MGINASSMFAKGIQKLTDGTIDFDTDKIKAVLVKKSYANTTLTTTNVDGHDFLDDVPPGDRADSQFITITTNDITVDGANNHVNYAAGTVSIDFTTVSNGTSCRGMVIFKSSGTEAASPLVCYNHFTSNVTADGGSVTVTLNSDGLFRASY